MFINLSPVRADEHLTVAVAGDTLTINGEAFDFSPLEDGATLPQDAIESEHFAGPVERINGELHVTLRLPHGANAPHETRFPSPIHFTGNGEVALPPYDEEDSE